MDKIWNRNPSKSEVIGRCGGDGKKECPRRTDKSHTLKKRKETRCLWYWVFILENKIHWVFAFFNWVFVNFRLSNTKLFLYSLYNINYSKWVSINSNAI